MQRREVVVAIDGPSGSGKSTIARAVAESLGFRYLDTGAMYRAITWLALHATLPLDDGGRLTELARTAELHIRTDPAAPRITADGNDVTDAVRGPDVTAAVSVVSAVPGVRTAMVERQREIIGSGGIVVEGRDIGTTVAPDAPVKIFLTADADTRARRRADQDRAAAGGAPNGETVRQVAATHADLSRRDAADSSRAASPLRQADDAVVLDSSTLDIAATVSRVLAQVNAVAGAGEGAVARAGEDAGERR